MRGVTAAAVADFASRRSQERGAKPGSKVSPATVNKELRQLRAAFNKAHKWRFLARPVDFDGVFLKESKRIATYVPPDHFAALYAACDAARLPASQPYTPGDWWRGLLVAAYLTGWRIGSLLSLRRADTDFEKGTALSDADDNKGKRDQLVALHPVVVEHLRALASFDPRVLPWTYDRRRLFKEFHAIQDVAGVRPEGRKSRYGFHDLRRGFATMNADRLSADALQHLMQHKDYQTTQRYINMARQLKPAVLNLFVPDLKPSKNAADA
jgi:integrase